jgi:hypothetical protein
MTVLYIYIYVILYYILETRSSVIENTLNLKNQVQNFWTYKKCSLQVCEGRAQITREFQVSNTLGMKNKAFT